jgi:hypothetical protein
MNKKKGDSPASSTIKAPRMVSVRDFVRGGYQHVDEPVLVMSQSTPMFAAYPVETSSDYLQHQPLASLRDVRAEPAWLGRGVDRGATLAPITRVVSAPGLLRALPPMDTSPATLADKLVRLGLSDVAVAIGLLPDCPACLAKRGLCAEHADFRASPPSVKPARAARAKSDRPTST